MNRPFKRIIIIGCGGSGKSTLAKKLSKKFSLELIHLDLHYWKPNWVETPKLEWEVKVKNLIKKPKWVMDGNYGGTMDLRITAADTIIFLKFPTRICLWREIKRTIKYFGKTRPTMTEGCPTRVSLEFWSYILHYNKTRTPGILSKLEKLNKSKHILIFTKQSEVDQFVSIKI